MWLGRYDLVLGFGMGLKITEEQRAQILAAADEGTPIYIYLLIAYYNQRNAGAWSNKARTGNLKQFDIKFFLTFSRFIFISIKNIALMHVI